MRINKKIKLTFLITLLIMIISGNIYTSMFIIEHVNKVRADRNTTSIKEQP